jgi:hypothetical protein
VLPKLVQEGLRTQHMFKMKRSSAPKVGSGGAENPARMIELEVLALACADILGSIVHGPKDLKFKEGT